MTAITPEEFFAVYVLPAVQLYGERLLEKHLAVNALSQVDNLAEVVAAHPLPPKYDSLRSRDPSKYRKQLRRQSQYLGIIHDAHDCHKHGKLDRKTASEPKGVSAGRPEQATDYAFFCGVTECGGDLTPYDVLAITLNDGTQCEVFALLAHGLQAWDVEFQRLGLSL